MYAPTTLAPARDFWTLRYTSILEDGSLVVSWIFLAVTSEFKKKSRVLAYFHSILPVLILLLLCALLCFCPKFSFP